MIRIRRATPDDAPVLAELVHAASEGFAEVFWRDAAAPGEDPWEVGRRRQVEKVASDEVEIWLLEKDGKPIAGLTGYPIGPAPAGPGDGTPPMARPLLELEAEAPSSWYVNVLAALPGHRGNGHGSELLNLAEHRALAAGSGALSIIVADNNDGARRLYERHGYVEKCRREMVKGCWQSPGHEWVLLLRPL